MADQETFPFRIVPLPSPQSQSTPEPPPRSPASMAEEDEPDLTVDWGELAETFEEVFEEESEVLPEDAATTEDGWTGGLFADGHAAFRFLGAMAGAGLAAEAEARRNHRDGRWWVQVHGSWRACAGHVFAVGGRPWVGSASGWSEMSADGGAPPSTTVACPANGGDWTSAGLGDLVTEAPLRPASSLDLTEAVVVAPGALVPSILRRTLARGLGVTVQAASCRALTGGAETAAALLRLDWTTQQPPRAFLGALANLPHTVVARDAGSDAGAGDTLRNDALLVDIRCLVPLSGALIASQVPQGQIWLLGDRDVGHWAVTPAGTPVDGASLLALPSMAPGGAAPGADAVLPPLVDIPLRLVAQAPAPGKPDAILLDDTELAWVRDYLMGQASLGDALRLVPGPGRHLLLEAGGLLATVPFGIPLRRPGRAALYVEEGWALFPPLPSSGATTLFPCAESEMVAVTRGDGALRADRFALAASLPVWSLWLGPPPPIADGIGGRAAKRLRELAEAIAAAQPDTAPAEPAPPGPRPVARSAEERNHLLQAALAADVAGDFARAAELFEQLGDFARAGYLYERAARP